MDIGMFGNRGRAYHSRFLTAMMGLIVAALAIMLAGCGGGGGGGGPSGTPTTVTGRVLRAETGITPNPNAVVTIGGVGHTTGADGVFTFSAPSNATTAIITAQGSMPRTITVALAPDKTNNLGDIYISDTGYRPMSMGGLSPP